MPDHLEDEESCEAYLFKVTGFRYSFAVSSERMCSEDSPVEKGDFYQIMPDHMDDGFFDWYCNKEPYGQFHLTFEDATIQFCLNWKQWRESRYLTFEQMKAIEPRLEAIEKQVLARNEDALSDEIWWCDVWHEIKPDLLQSVGHFCKHPELMTHICWDAAGRHLSGLATNMK